MSCIYCHPLHIKAFLQPSSFGIQRLQRNIKKPGDPELQKEIKSQKQKFWFFVLFCYRSISLLSKKEKNLAVLRFTDRWEHALRHMVEGNHSTELQEGYAPDK